MSESMLLPAFSDAVLSSQMVFRTALKAMSEPGLPHTVDDSLALERLSSLDPASYALCLALMDNDTPVWLAPGLDTPALRANLAFHCGCSIVSLREQAAFALLTVNELDDLSGFTSGTDRDPDQSCTLLVQLPDLEQGQAASWQGPGILHKRTVRLPVNDRFWSQRNVHLFPRGLDVFFTAGNRLMGLPRSTRVLHAVQEGN